MNNNIILEVIELSLAKISELYHLQREVLMAGSQWRKGQKLWLSGERRTPLAEKASANSREERTRRRRQLRPVSFSSTTSAAAAGNTHSCHPPPPPSTSRRPAGYAGDSNSTPYSGGLRMPQQLEGEEKMTKQIQICQHRRKGKTTTTQRIEEFPRGRPRKMAAGGDSGVFLRGISQGRRCCRACQPPRMPRPPAAPHAQAPPLYGLPPRTLYQLLSLSRDLPSHLSAGQRRYERGSGVRRRQESIRPSHQSASPLANVNQKIDNTGGSLTSMVVFGRARDGAERRQPCSPPAHSTNKTSPLSSVWAPTPPRCKLYECRFDRVLSNSRPFLTFKNFIHLSQGYQIRCYDNSNGDINKQRPLDLREYNWDEMKCMLMVSPTLIKVATPRGLRRETLIATNFTILQLQPIYGLFFFFFFFTATPLLRLIPEMLREANHSKTHQNLETEELLGKMIANSMNESKEYKINRFGLLL